MSTKSAAQPIDRNTNPIPVLSPAGTPASDTLAATSQALALPTGYQIVEIAALGNAYIAFGTSGGSVTSSGQLFVAGHAQYRVPDGATHLHHLEQDAADDGKVITVVGLI